MRSAVVVSKSNNAIQNICSAMKMRIYRGLPNKKDFEYSMLWRPKMAGNNERRRGMRYKTNAEMLLGKFNSFDYCCAKESNHSSNGISFKCDLNLKPGTIIQIRRKGCPEDCPKGDACDNCRMTALATIKWCHENKTQTETSYFIGAKYFEYGIGY